MKKKILITCISILLLATGCLSSYAASVSDIKDKKNSVTNEKKEVQKELSNVQNEKKSTSDKIQELNDQIQTSQTQLDNLNAQITELQSSIKQLEGEIEAAQQRYNDQQAALEKRVVAQYKTGKTSYLDMILNASSLSEFISQYYLVGKIAKADNQLLDSIENEKNTIERNKQKLVEQETQIKAARAEIEKENTKLKNARNEKSKQMGNLTAAERELQNKIEDYLKKENELEQQIKNAEKQNNNSNNNDNKYTGGQFLWPCPSSKRITCGFGSREQPVAGASRYHQGIDIGAAYGSDIVAAADGTVVTATYSASAGNYIMISHGSGLYTVYMHSSKLVASVGQRVSRGQTIAKVGSTGISTGNHLHFGVRKNGTYVNPLNYLQ